MRTRASAETARGAAAEVYRRQLPGGGYAVIEICERRRFFVAREFLGRVIVERRTSASRRPQHQPPVVLETHARSRERVLDDLFPIVLSNVALATACHRR